MYSDKLYLNANYVSLNENKLTARDLKYKYNKKFQLNQNLQLIAAILTSSASVKDFSEFQESIVFFM